MTASAQAVTSCSSASAGGGFVNQAIATQNGRFHVEFDATPSSTGVDAVVGLSDGGASRFAQLAAIVRFNESGTLDARAGAVYRADETIAYQAGTSYHIRLDVDLGQHTYSAWVRFAGQYTRIASSLPFRSEQAATTELDNVASEADASGTLEVCNIVVVTDGVGNGCVVAEAGGGPVSIPLPDATVFDTVMLSASTNDQNIDAVFGLSGGPIARFSDIAVAIRFAPSGIIDFRDGDVYRADEPDGYPQDRLFVLADVTSHRYSVQREVEHELARQYRFRTEQSAVTHLDHLGAIVDGDHGSITVCANRVTPSQGVAYTREGFYTVIPLAADNEAMIGTMASRDSALDRVDASGRVLHTFTSPGRLAADPSGNVFEAAPSIDNVVVRKRGRDGNLLWEKTFPVTPSNNRPTLAEQLIAFASGDVYVSLNAFETQTLRISADGTTVTTETPPAPDGGDVVVLDDGYLVWRNPRISQGTGVMEITRLDRAGNTVWQRDFTVDYTTIMNAPVVDPAGNILFGGLALNSPDFGGGPIPPSPGDNKAFVVKLTSAGDHVFSMRPRFDVVAGLASNGDRIVVSGSRRPGPWFTELISLDASGGPGHVYGGPGWPTDGAGYGVAMGPTGRVWWTRKLSVGAGGHEPVLPPFLFALEE